MKRILIHFSLLVIVFFATLFLFRQINWLSVLKIEKATKSLDENLGKTFWKIYSETEQEIKTKSIKSAIDSLVETLCNDNSIDKSKIKIHILNKDEVNAFTLPNHYLVIYSGLIKACDNEAELLGVIGHEIAHMEKNHVMKKLVKEIGLSVLISMSSGGSGEAIKEAAKVLSSTAYDRDLEREADLASVEYLLNSKIDPEPFANFLFRLSVNEENIPEQAYWLSTHPESRERAENIIAYIKGRTIKKNKILSLNQWNDLKKEIDN